VCLLGHRRLDASRQTPPNTVNSSSGPEGLLKSGALRALQQESRVVGASRHSSRRGTPASAMAKSALPSVTLTAMANHCSITALSGGTGAEKLPGYGWGRAIMI